MTYLTIQEARQALEDMLDDAKLCPSCMFVLQECNDRDGKPNYLMCWNDMCSDETQYPISQGINK